MIEGERHTEQVDAANHLVDVYTRIAIQKQTAQIAPEQEKLPDGTWPVTECVDCGDSIHPKRLEMARVRCVHCQEIKERRINGYR